VTPRHDQTRAVVRVGDGRGFVVELRGNRYIITAAHCLPHLPPPHGFSYAKERTYANLIGPLGEEPGIWVECVFVDPVADIALLAQPDGGELFDAAVAYEEFVEGCGCLIIGYFNARRNEHKPAWLLSLENQWQPCMVAHYGGALAIKNAVSIRGGMSGSPILAEDGSAIGMVCLGTNIGGDAEEQHEGGPNPRLTYNLPAWALRATD
jgi:hypothetical protein